MGMLAIFLMITTLKTVNAVTVWDCSGEKLLKTTVNFSDINDEKLIMSLKKLGNKYADEFAYKFMGMEGYIAYVKDDKFDIFQCNPVAAILQPQKKCYDRLQIVIHDEKLFLTPWTHVVATNATEISCNEPYLQHYELEFYTLKVVPRPEGSLDTKKVDSETRDPNDPSPIKVLKPSTKLTWKYTELDNLGTSGIYNENDFNSAWDKILHPESRPIIDEPLHISRPRLVYKNPNNVTVSWYEKSIFLCVGIAALLIIIIVCTSLILAGSIKHGAALHFFRCKNGHRQLNCDQADLTLRLNKETV